MPEYNIAEVLLDPFFHNIDNIHRFNKEPVIKQENDTQHSWWVTLFCKCLMDETFTSSTPEMLDLRVKILEGALLHDYPEVFTGDVNFDLKYNQLNGKAIKELMWEYEEQELGNFINKGGSIAGMAISVNDLQMSIVAMYVKIGDWLAVTKNVLQEIRMGNRLMKKLFKHCKSHLLNAISDLMNAVETGTRLSNYPPESFNTAGFYKLAQVVNELKYKNVKNGKRKKHKPADAGGN